jgi:hypothetical protein
LLWLVPLDWHDQLSSKWILSHFTWYKSRRSRHLRIERNDDGSDYSLSLDLQNSHTSSVVAYLVITSSQAHPYHPHKRQRQNYINNSYCDK